MTTVKQFFQEHYLDTNKIPQAFIDKYRGKVRGNQPEDVKRCVVGDLTFKYNGRRPKATDIMNYIRKEDGLNWHLFKTLDLAKVGDEVVDIWNALHRAIIACVVLGPDAEVPALISKFDIPEQIHSNFWKDNGGRTKSVTPEQNHVAQIRSLEPEDLNNKINRLLMQIGNTVVHVEDDIFEPQTSQPDWAINVGPMKQMIHDIADDTHIIDGAKTYQKTFIHTYNGVGPYKIIGQIFQALVFILEVESDYLSRSTDGKSNLVWFVDWLMTRAKTSPNKAKHWLYKQYAHDRMEKRYVGTAFGIWEDFVSYCGSSITRGSSKATNVRLEKLYNNGLSQKKAA
jgi:hypothetical protein